MDCLKQSVLGRHTGRRQSNAVDDDMGRHNGKKWGTDADNVCHILPVNSVAEAATVLGRTMLRTHLDSGDLDTPRSSVGGMLVESDIRAGVHGILF